MFWDIYNVIAGLFVATQVLFIFQMIQNYRYALHKSSRRRDSYKPVTLLTVPCKGIDKAFEKNITSFYKLDYDSYYLNFVVEDSDDDAYEKLNLLKEKLALTSKALDVRILVAGLADSSSQKIHNLLHSCANAVDDTEVFAFADSDACLDPDWLAHLVHPLRKKRHGASTGYRWFVPSENNLATLVLSAINGKIAQMLGNTGFNQAWGGSMAIRSETFKELNLDKLWATAVSDDLCLSSTVKKAGLKIMYVPACLVASHEHTTWPKLFEFARRQFLITRVTMPGVWVFAVFCSLYSLAGLWAAAAVAVFAAVVEHPNALFYASIPVLFFAGQLIRSVLRQKMIAKLLPADADNMKAAAMVDILGNCVWSWVLFGCIISSAFGRTITWRGIRYKMISGTKTEKMD
ncbi:MAG: glycosyltransferase family 2 protein [Planctomycetes bacterium]|nr:glycosyltransferase family 2 protein [Planctomycetota bacterium]